MLVGAVGIGIENGARAGAIEYSRNAGHAVMPRIGVKRYALHIDLGIQLALSEARQRLDQFLDALNRLQRIGQNNALALDANALGPAGTLDQRN